MAEWIINHIKRPIIDITNYLGESMDAEHIVEDKDNNSNLEIKSKDITNN